jgi:hypothetical protein
MGARVLNPEFTYGRFPRPSHYVQRDNSNCAADFENGLPAIGTFIPLGTPRVAADPTQGAFFIANVGFHAGDGVKGVNIVKEHPHVAQRHNSGKIPRRATFLNGSVRTV